MGKIIILFFVFLILSGIIWIIVATTIQLAVKEDFEKKCYQKGGDFAWVSLTLDCFPNFCYNKVCYKKLGAD